jgi:arginyl-tRNA synthetase
VLPGDIGAELAVVITAAVAAGELPPATAGLASAAGTWRPPPDAVPGAYSSSLPFRLAARSGRGARDVAGLLAARLRGTTWISGAGVTGPGYLTVTVSPDALAGLAVRVALAGPACARSDALRGRLVSAPRDADLATAATWAQAHERCIAVVSGRLAAAAGAQVTDNQNGKRMSRSTAARRLHQGPAGLAMAFAGPDAVRYALARIPPGRAVAIDAEQSVKHVLGNPFYAVSFAHADASATLRRAAGLGLSRGAPAGFRPSLACPAERALLAVMSWLPERVAGAARRRHPHELARFAEQLAAAYLDVRDLCPALPSGGRSAPRDPHTAAARLWLADAARASLAAALGLLGVRPPDRL